MRNKQDFKIIFVLGGVFSGIGKGVVSSSIGKLLKNNSLQVSMQKHDPYLNVDCGLLNPSEHGEVFTTQDGLETDLDLGNYERFLNQKMSVLSSITAGQIYQELLQEERNQHYKGKTINIYNVASKIKEKIFTILEKEKSDCVVVELGGTVGDNDLKPFLIAAAQLQKSLPKHQVVFVFLVYIHYLQYLSQFKTKPAQNAIATLRNNGIEPDLVILRSSREILPTTKQKFVDACYLPLNRVFTLLDTDIYFVPLLLFQNNFFGSLIKHLQINNNLSLPKIEFVSQQIAKLQQSNKKVKIVVINKYSNFKQSYFSLYHAFRAAAFNTGINFEITEVNPEKITVINVKTLLSSFNGILIPGGFGSRGVAGKILAVQFARQNQIPFLGICLGFQIALIEFARNVIGLQNADSEEFTENSKESKDLIVHYFDSKSKKMLIGEKRVEIKKQTLMSKIFNTNFIYERFRHRLVFNEQYFSSFVDKGMVFSGFNKEYNKYFAVILELKKHPFFVGTQFHLELNSQPEKSHFVLTHFLQVCYQEQFHKK